MKPVARESFRTQLSKALKEDPIEGLDIANLPDKELKDLYLKLQAVKSGRCCYGVIKGNVFEDDMRNGKLQFLSFRDTFKYGVRPLTLREFLLLEDFAATNPSSPYNFLIKGE